MINCATKKCTNSLFFNYQLLRNLGFHKCDFSWTIKEDFLSNDFWHVAHWCFSVPVWTFICLFNLLINGNRVLQILQSYGLMPVWSLSWIFKELRNPNALSQVLQVNDLSSVWTSSWCLSLFLSKKALAHVAHLNVFSPLWILSCCFMLLLVLNTFKQVLHWCNLSLAYMGKGGGRGGYVPRVKNFFWSST